MLIVAAAVVVAVWELHKGFLAKDIDLPEQPLMLGGVVMVVVAYFYGAPALVTATAVTALVIMLWLLRRGIDGLRHERHRLGLHAGLRAVPRLVRRAACSPRAAPTGGGLDDDGVQGIITFIVVTIASDIGGYIAGVLFGRHPMAPVISPEEVLGGLRRLAGLLRGRRCRARGLPPRRRLVGRRRARADRGRDGHPGRPVRVGDQARPRHQGHEPGDPRATAA